MKKKFGTFLSLLTIASAAIPSCIISSCRASDDGIYVKPSEVSNAEFNSETNTLKIINDYYNPLQTEKYYWSWLMLDAVDKSDDHWHSTIKKCTLDLSTVPDDLKNKIFVTLEDGSCLIWFEQSANILEWDEFTITVNYGCSISKGSYTFNVAPQRQNRTYKLDHTLFTGEFNSTKTEIAWRGTNQDPNSGNIKNLIIDDYENNPNWKQNGYKTLQIGNPYTWRSWNKMFYKYYSLLPSLHHYFNGFTNEVPIVRDGSSTGELGTPTKHINLLQKMLV